MAKRGGESMQKALRDELEKYQVTESVALKEGEILVTKCEELPCNFVFHVSCKSILLFFLYLYYQSLRPSILQSTYKEFYFIYLFILFYLTLSFFILQQNSCTNKLVCQKYSTLIYVNKYTMRKIY